MADYGVLTGLVDDIGALIAASVAIMLSFKGRQRWEPSEEDVPKGPVKVVGALTAVGVGLLYWGSQTQYVGGIYFWLALSFSILLVVGFLTYVILITVYTYEKVVAVGRRETRTDKIIGGFWLTDHAREVQRQNPEAKNVQTLLEGMAYKVDDVWPRLARGLSKVSFLMAYFAVIIGGCLALAAVAIMLNQLTSLSQ